MLWRGLGLAVAHECEPVRALSSRTQASIGTMDVWLGRVDDDAGLRRRPEGSGLRASPDADVDPGRGMLIAALDQGYRAGVLMSLLSPTAASMTARAIAVSCSVRVSTTSTT